MIGSLIAGVGLDKKDNNNTSGALLKVLFRTRRPMLNRAGDIGFHDVANNRLFAENILRLLANANTAGRRQP